MRTQFKAELRSHTLHPSEPAGSKGAADQCSRPLMVKTQLLICTLNPLCCAAQSDQTANEQNSIGERDYVGKMELKVQLKLVPYIKRGS